MSENKFTVEGEVGLVAADVGAGRDVTGRDSRSDSGRAGGPGGPGGPGGMGASGGAGGAGGDDGGDPSVISDLRSIPVQLWLFALSLMVAVLSGVVIAMLCLV